MAVGAQRASSVTVVVEASPVPLAVGPHIADAVAIAVATSYAVPEYAVLVTVAWVKDV